MVCLSVGAKSCILLFGWEFKKRENNSKVLMSNFAFGSAFL
mgnify:FL=1